MQIRIAKPVKASFGESHGTTGPASAEPCRRLVLVLQPIAMAVKQAPLAGLQAKNVGDAVRPLHGLATTLGHEPIHGPHDCLHAVFYRQ